MMRDSQVDSRKYKIKNKLIALRRYFLQLNVNVPPLSNVIMFTFVGISGICGGRGYGVKR